MKKSLVIIIVLGVFGISCKTKNESNLATKSTNADSTQFFVDTTENILSNNIINKNVISF